MKQKKLINLMNSTVLHEWLHAKALKNICGEQNVFIVHGLGDKERGKKLKEEYFANSKEYKAYVFDNFSYYMRNDGKKMSRGRADVNNRLVLSEEGVKMALKKPLKGGISISLAFLLLLILFDVLFILNDKYLHLIFANVILFYPILLGALCAGGCFFGEKSDYRCWRNPKMYIEQLDEDFIEDISRHIQDRELFNTGHIVLDEEFYDVNVVGKEDIVCNHFDCKTMSVLINGCLEFIHNTQIGNVESIIKNGLIVPDNSESKNDTLGRGIYCYDYNEYLKGNNPTMQRVTTVSFKGKYNGEYLKCVYGYAASNHNTSLKEYLLLQGVPIVTLIK